MIYTIVKVDGATPKKGGLVRGYDKPIHGSCAIYFPAGIPKRSKNGLDEHVQKPQLGDLKPREQRQCLEEYPRLLLSPQKKKVSNFVVSYMPTGLFFSSASFNLTIFLFDSIS